jgi:hypothetical protein
MGVGTVAGQEVADAESAGSMARWALVRPLGRRLLTLDPPDPWCFGRGCGCWGGGRRHRIRQIHGVVGTTAATREEVVKKREKEREGVEA